MSKLYTGLNRFLKDEDGPTMAEYGLLLLFIALAVASGAHLLGTGISTFFNAAGTAIGGATIPTIP